jgi:hypothetical protein
MGGWLVETDLMKKYRIALLLLLLVGLAVAARSSYAKAKGESGRLLTGIVTDRQDRPLPDAVVYLSDSRTRAVKTFIVGPSGAYRFPALSPNVDYEVYAQYNGHKSDTKTVSQFDDRQQVTINLRIDTK